MDSKEINIYNYIATTTSVGSLINDLNRDKKIILDPVYQRDIVWDIDNYVKYIESVMKGISSPNLTFSNNKEGKICIDGKQRCTALKRFYNNEFPIEIDGVEHYFSKIIENKENKDNKKKAPKILTSEQQRIFENRLLNIIEYRDLKYGDQAEIFTRLQFGKNLTGGEIIVSKIQNEEVSIDFNKYCLQHGNALKKYYKVERKEQYSYIAELMYVIHAEMAKCISKKTIDNFLAKLNKKEMTNLCAIIDKIIENLFTDKIMKNSKIIKLKLSKSDELLVIPYKLYNSFIKDNKEDNVTPNIENIINIICNSHNKFKKMQKRGKQKSVFDEMSEIFDEEYDIIMKENKEDDEEIIEEKKKEIIEEKKKKITIRKKVKDE
jgi:hypothetical protein